MRLAVLSLALVPGLLWAAPKEGRIVVSANKRWTLKLVQDGPHCRFQATYEDELAWTLDKCVATVDDLYFPSNDGQQFWVLYPLPEKPRRKGWWTAVGARLVDKDGNVLASRAVGDFVKTKVGRLEVEQLKAHVKWLEGALGKKGKPPRLTDGNQIEFETLEPKTMKLAFRDLAKEAAKAAAQDAGVAGPAGQKDAGK